MQLGLYAIWLLWVNIIHCFTWQLPDGIKPSALDMSDVMGLIDVPNRRLT